MFGQIALNSGYLTNALAHSIRSLEQVYGRISRCPKAAPINLPDMRGVITTRNTE